MALPSPLVLDVDLDFRGVRYQVSYPPCSGRSASYLEYSLPLGKAHELK